MTGNHTPKTTRKKACVETRRVLPPAVLVYSPEVCVQKFFAHSLQFPRLISGKKCSLLASISFGGYREQQKRERVCVCVCERYCVRDVVCV